MHCDRRFLSLIMRVMISIEAIDETNGDYCLNSQKFLPASNLLEMAGNPFQEIVYFQTAFATLMKLPPKISLMI